MIVEEFSIAFAGHPPKWFAREIINTRLQARTVVVGHDFRYGKARGGTVQSLRKTLPDVKVCQISAFQKEDEVVSSSRIRKLVQEGEVFQAKKLLGEAYTLRGIAVAGKMWVRGRMRSRGGLKRGSPYDDEITDVKKSYNIACNNAT